LCRVFGIDCSSDCEDDSVLREYSASKKNKKRLKRDEDDEDLILPENNKTKRTKI
jgi:hypothetical protein